MADAVDMTAATLSLWRVEREWVGEPPALEARLFKPDPQRPGSWRGPSGTSYARWDSMAALLFAGWHPTQAEAIADARALARARIAHLERWLDGLDAMAKAAT